VQYALPKQRLGESLFCFFSAPQVVQAFSENDTFNEAPLIKPGALWKALVTSSAGMRYTDKARPFLETRRACLAEDIPGAFLMWDLHSL
jgi:hypothetical protein